MATETPRLSTRFTDVFLKSVKATGAEFERNEGNGFGIRVSPAGAITFQFRYRRDGKKQRIKLGTYPIMSLKDARARAREAAGLLDRGVDPIVEGRERRQAAEEAKAAREAAAQERSHAQTVRDLADEWMARYVRVERKRPDHVHGSGGGDPTRPCFRPGQHC